MDLYYMPDSPPCCATLMTAKAVGVELNLKLVDLMADEHLKPEYIKINPQHTIPTLVDNGFAMWESRAIMVYLAEKYAKTDSLYPKCPRKRAIINQRLYFDMGTLYQRYCDYYYPQVFFGSKEPFDPEKFKKMEEAFELLEIFLKGQQYVAGESLTLADIALVATVSVYEVTKFNINKYPNVAKWYKHCQTVIPGIEINQHGTELFKKYFDVLN